MKLSSSAHVSGACYLAVLGDGKLKDEHVMCDNGERVEILVEKEEEDGIFKAKFLCTLSKIIDKKQDI